MICVMMDGSMNIKFINANKLFGRELRRLLVLEHVVYIVTTVV